MPSAVPYGTGLPGPLYPALVRRCTFVLILYSLYAPNRTGLLSGRPCGTLRYKQLSQLGAGRGMHIVPNGCGCDAAMIQPSRKSLENVETPGPGRSPGWRVESEKSRRHDWKLPGDDPRDI